MLTYNGRHNQRAINITDASATFRPASYVRPTRVLQTLRTVPPVLRGVCLPPVVPACIFSFSSRRSVACLSNLTLDFKGLSGVELGFDSVRRCFALGSASVSLVSARTFE